MRLIDADALKKEFPKDTDWEYPVNTNEYVCEKIDEQPTIEEQKKGHWTEEHEHVYMGNVVKEWTNWYCSECDAPNDKPTDFCPHCGRKMEATYDD